MPAEEATLNTDALILNFVELVLLFKGANVNPKSFGLTQKKRRIFAKILYES